MNNTKLNNVINSLSEKMTEIQLRDGIMTQEWGNEIKFLRSIMHELIDLRKEYELENK